MTCSCSIFNPEGRTQSMQTNLSIFILYKRIELLNEDSKEGTEKRDR